jgi:hypothetical protein
MVIAITGSSANVDVDDFLLYVSSSVLEIDTTYSASISPNSNNYIGAIFGTDEKGTGAVYLSQIFNTAVSASIAGGKTFSTSSNSFTTSSATITTSGYSNAESPTVISQTFAGTINHELFKFHSLESGTTSNQKIKVGIFNIKQASEVAGSDYGSFGLVVRE